ncbi:FliG C-terminal domain-containing protein [Oceanispirochaeta sp.]|jgi:flagellar motor switch protein FliG|uniref:FliG C-terminal domain-containing protein n=1 Tax=Oceanispirochaeta sp. TaxID=2035350 RepID=UPI00263396A0|nr:FliG C-terminal domain-containing protein [Oceanispirochaeta sp.]MDA3956182.1 hypothetical protein [Oceanispirochaeta sp.]
MKFIQKGIDAYKAESNKSDSKLDSSENAALKALQGEENKSLPQAPGLIKTGNISKGGAAQAARFLLLLGKEEGGHVLRNMSEAEIEQVTAEIARIKEIRRDEALEILQKFGHKINLKGEGVGGLDTARDFLIGAFGEDKARQILSKAVPESNPHHFSFMNVLSLPQMLQVLKEEPVETCSIILSFMNPNKVSSYLKTCEKDIQVQLIRNMALKRELNPEILSRMNIVLQEKAHRIGRLEEIVIDGEDRLAEILKHMDSGSEKRILGDLEEGNPELSRKIKEQIHTINCIFQLRPKDLQNLLLEMNNDKLAFILRGKEDKIKEHILSHLSSQRKLIVEETMIISPRVSRKDVDKETREFLNIIKKREEEGSYILLSEDEEDLI